MSVTSDDVLEIMKLIEGSHFSEIRLEMDGLKLVIGKGPRGGAVLEGEAGTEKAPAGTVAQAPSPASGKTVASDGPEVSAKGRPLPVCVSAQEENLISIRAPLLGTFYATPKPGAPPFVKAGQTVNEDDVVCLIEVMKLFNTVKAGVKGRVVKVCVEQGQVVEFQQPLFLVEPALEVRKAGSKKSKDRAS